MVAMDVDATPRAGPSHAPRMADDDSDDILEDDCGEGWKRASLDERRRISNSRLSKRYESQSKDRVYHHPINR
jgi:hypothetical protein